jgi:hypothetical protein
MGAEFEEVELSAAAVEAAARVIADAFDLEIGGYRATSVAEEVLLTLGRFSNHGAHNKT